MKKVLITGANSYIGDSIRDYLLQFPNDYSVTVRDTYGWDPQVSDFDNTDVVFSVAGIAHIKETKENRHLFFEVNRDLTVKIAMVAKKAGVKQFVLLSTMSVYGLSVGHVTKETVANPNNAYGQSKAEADEEIRKLEDAGFKFACIRPPMVYGKGCKGNYQSLRAFALKSPVFPDYDNQRSMIYIGNLCEFVKETIDQEKSGVFFPQNDEYVSTKEMVRLIAENNGKQIKLVKCFNWAIRIAPFLVVKKVFGSLTYEKDNPVCKFSFAESISQSER